LPSLPIPLLAGEAEAALPQSKRLSAGKEVKTMSYTRYRGDPYWKRAKSDGISVDGTAYSQGDRVFFYPRTGATYAGGSAQRASAEFDELAALEG
jgi:hypothetical protein